MLVLVQRVTRCFSKDQASPRTLRFFRPFTANLRALGLRTAHKAMRFLSTFASSWPLMALTGPLRSATVKGGM